MVIFEKNGCFYCNFFKMQHFLIFKTIKLRKSFVSLKFMYQTVINNTNKERTQEYIRTEEKAISEALLV